MIKKILKQKLKYIKLNPSTGQLIKITFLNKLDSLCKRFNTNYKKDSNYFINKLIKVLDNIDIEDLGQQLELLKYESKFTPGWDWSDTYKTKVINFIMKYDTVQTEPLDPIVVYQHTKDMITTRNLTPFQKQVYNLYLVDGYLIDELADHYHVHRVTVHQWLREIKTILSNYSQPFQKRS